MDRPPARFRSIRAQIIFSFCVLMVAGGLVTTGAVEYVLRQSLQAVAATHGHQISHMLARQVAEPLAAGDWVTARLIAATEAAHNRYVLVLRDERAVWVDKDGESAPPTLIRLVESSPAAVFEIRGEPVLDKSAPIAGGGVVHVGVSLSAITSAMRSAIQATLAATVLALIAGVIGISFLASLITRPIGRLTRVVQAMGEGDTNMRAPVTGTNELKELATSFNGMATQIRARIEQSDHLRAHYERILDHLPVGAILCDHDGTIEYSNRMVREIEDTFAERLCRDTAAENDHDGRSQGAASDHGLPRQRTITLDDGRAFAMNVGPFENANESRSLVVTLVDVTSMRELSKHLRQAERLAVAGEFSAGIVHAINNPLDGVGRALKLARQSPLDVQRTAEMLTLALEGVDRIANVTRALLSFARVDPDQPPVIVSPAMLIRQATNLLGLAAEQRGVRLIVEVAPDVPNIEVDPPRVVEVLANLIQNSIDASYHGGEVRIAASRGAGDWLELVVADDGVGIPSEQVGRIFEPLFTTKATGEGTGLGLSMVRRIVELYGGRVAAKSAVGVGATFTVRLPVAPEAAVHATRERKLQ